MKMKEDFQEIMERVSVHCDFEADINNTSPDDSWAFENGLIYQICQKWVG